MDKTHISYSQISTYTSCPAHYLFSYICGIKMPPKAIMAQGSAVHHSLALGYGYKMQHNKDPKVDSLLDAYEDDFKNRLIKEEIEMTAKDLKPSKMIDDGVRVLKTYHEQKMPTVNPIEVEKEISVDFKNKDYYLKGYIDLVDKQEKGNEIVDHKFTKMTPNKNAMYASEQLATYALGYRQLSGEKERKVRFDYLVNNKIPKIVTIEKKITNYDLQKVLTNIAYVMEAIENNQFYCFHKPFEAWICSPEFCAYEERGLHKELVMIGVNKFIDKYGKQKR